MNQEEIKKRLLKTLKEAENPREELHEMYKNKMKDIVAASIFCYMTHTPETHLNEFQKKVIMEDIMVFCDAFIESNCISAE